MPPAEAMHLPVNWTQTDQEIIETLLFDQPLGSYKYAQTARTKI